MFTFSLGTYSAALYLLLVETIILSEFSNNRWSYSFVSTSFRNIPVLAHSRRLPVFLLGLSMLSAQYLDHWAFISSLFLLQLLYNVTHFNWIKGSIIYTVGAFCFSQSVGE